MNASHNNQAFAEAAVNHLDAAEYVVRITSEGVLVYEEVDVIVLDI